MKKVLTVLLCMMLSLSLFAGGAKDTAATETAADNGKTKLEFWTWLSSDDAIDAYNQMQDEVEIVKVQMSHADINAKLAIALQAGTGAPDIYQTTQRYYPQFRDSGHMYDMTAVVSDVMDGYPSSLQDLVTYNGQIAGLTPDVSPSVMFYRADIFEEYGIEIETFNDLIEAAKILKEDGIYMLPIFNPAGSWGANAVGMLLGSRGGNYFTPDGKVIHDNEDLEIVLEFLDQQADRFRRDHRLAVLVQQRGEPGCVSVFMKQVVDAGLGIHPNFGDLDDTLMIDLLKPFHGLSSSSWAFYFICAHRQTKAAYRSTGRRRG